jgi:hypothetical protein
MPTGAFGAHPEHDAHLLPTLSAIQILVMHDALDRLDVDRVVKCASILFHRPIPITHVLIYQSYSPCNSPLGYSQGTPSARSTRGFHIVPLTPCLCLDGWESSTGRRRLGIWSGAGILMAGLGVWWGRKAMRGRVRMGCKPPQRRLSDSSLFRSRSLRVRRGAGHSGSVGRHRC